MDRSVDGGDVEGLAEVVDEDGGTRDAALWAMVRPCWMESLDRGPVLVRQPDRSDKLAVARYLLTELET